MNTPLTEPSTGHQPSGPKTISPTIIAVSLKLYFDVPRTRSWCEEVAAIAHTHPAIIDGTTELLVLPSVVALAAATEAMAGTPVRIGAQDLFHEDRGAFTGAVSGTDLREVGCTYVEVGHLERRTVFGDDDRIVALKTRAAWRNDLIPLLCIGETRKDTTHASIVECMRQLDSALPEDLRLSATVLVAYEPAWAIGASRPADSAHVRAVVSRVRTWLATHRPGLTARVIYGGSAGVGQLTELGDVVDGLFLGRFAHDTTALAAILDEQTRPTMSQSTGEP